MTCRSHSTLSQRVRKPALAGAHAPGCFEMRSPSAYTLSALPCTGLSRMARNFLRQLRGHRHQRCHLSWSPFLVSVVFVWDRPAPGVSLDLCGPAGREGARIRLEGTVGERWGNFRP